MKIIKKYNNALPLLIVALLLTAGCNKEIEIDAESGALMKFDVSMPDGMLTKGAHVEEISSFKAAAYDGSIEYFLQAEGNTEEITLVGGDWKPSHTYYWHPGKVLTFYAYSSFPATGASVDFEHSAMTLSYELPLSSSDQSDILLGYYKGDGANDGKATINFIHPLTSLTFLKGDIYSGAEITGIKISGIVSEGKAVMSSDGTIDWTANDYAGEANGTASDHFLIIPQNLEEHPIDVTVALSTGREVVTKLQTGTLDAGKTNVITLGYEDREFEFELASSADSDYEFKNTTTSATKNIALTSSVSKDGGTPSAQTWTIKRYVINGDVHEVNSDSFSAGGLTVTAESGTSLRVVSSPRPTTERYTKEFWQGNNGDWSPADWSDGRASASSPIDLSLFDFRVEGSYDKINTANCYIIRHAGTYMFPLVYGNAVTDSHINEESYFPHITAEQETERYRLLRFVNHTGNGIISPFIEYNTTDGQPKSGSNQYLTPVSCDVIWQDRADNVKDLSLTSPQTIKVDGIEYQVKYLKFTVDKNEICQNNALIAVKDAGGNVLWSWHIWITNDPALRSAPIPVFNYDDVEYDFMALPCLGWISPVEYNALPDVKITLEQSQSGKEIDILIRQPGDRGTSTGTWYQFGRKDPILNTNSPATGSFVTGQGQVSVEQGILNPGVFYVCDQTINPINSDWSDSHYYNLWTGRKTLEEGQHSDMDADIIKTVYDPSPVGYMVPSDKAYTGFTTTGGTAKERTQWNMPDPNQPERFGRTFYTKLGPGHTVNTGGPVICMETAGYRRASDGKDGSIGSQCYYWTSCTSSTSHAFTFRFTAGVSAQMIPMNTNERAIGFSVRPVLH